MIRFLFAFISVLTIALGCSAVLPLEGEWQVNGGGARLKFVQSAGTTDVLDIIWLDGPDFSIPPGTVIGSATATPTPGYYDCTVDTDPRRKGDKRKYTRFTVKINDNDASYFVFKPYEQTVKFRIQTLLPYWWRRPIKESDSRPKDIDGARRQGAPKPYVEL